VIDALGDLIENSWGKGELVSFYAPSMAGDERFRRWAARLERNSVSPQGARQILRIGAESDIRDVLPRIKAPTLVLHRRDDTFVPLSEAEELAAGIPDARLVVVEGRDNMGWVGDQESLLDETEEFLTGTRAERPAERVLSTVLFTDIVGSTDLAARLSDSRWRDLLAEHDRLLREEIESCDGRVIKSTGDGVLATFDRPAQAVRAARGAIDAVAGLGVRVRAGVHTGEVEVLEDDVGGLAVHIGARIVDMAEPEQVLVSGTVGGILVGSGLRFTAEGTHRLRGVPGEWPLYALADGSSSD
jgi:class 3 adenylate cyclase